MGESVQATDFDQLEQHDQPHWLSAELERYWQEECRQSENTATSGLSPSEPPLIPHVPSLLRALWSMFSRILAANAAILLVYMCTSVAQPLLLRQLILCLSSGQTDGGDYGSGWWWSSLLLAAAVAQGTLHHIMFFHNQRWGIQMRVAVTGLVYAKALRLSSATFAQTTTGQLVNLIANDAEKFEQLSIHLNYVWEAPLVAGIVLVLLFREIGLAALFGYTALILTIPMQSRFSKRFSELRRSTVSHTDMRLKAINELLAGVQVVKVECWEEAISAQIELYRAAEIESISKAAVYKALNVGHGCQTGMFFSTGSFLAFVSFVGRVALGGALSSTNVFTTLALFNIIRYPVSMFLPTAVEKLAECRISLARLDTFLGLAERACIPTNVYAAPSIIPSSLIAAASELSHPTAPSPCVLEIIDGDFSWGSFSSLASMDGTSISASVGISRNSTSIVDLTDIITEGETQTTDVVVEVDHGDDVEIKSHSLTISGDLSSANNSYDPYLCLRGINLKIERGSLVMVVGPIGSGKSSLLSAILGEMKRQRGHVHLYTSEFTSPSSLSIATQKPWIFAASVRENVVFERPFESERYARVLRACQLTDDIQALSAGDATVIGERGVNLSGGQKARVALARAVYSQHCDLYLLDDPLAAVDALVAKKLMDQVLGHRLSSQARQTTGVNEIEPALLQYSTRVLVTHHTHLLHLADLVVVMQNGRIEFSGSFGAFVLAAFDSKTLGQVSVDEHSVSYYKEHADVNADKRTEVKDSLEITNESSPDVTEPLETTSNLIVSSSNDVLFAMSTPSSHNTETSPNVITGSNQLVQAEQSQAGLIDHRVLHTLLAAAGGGNLVIALLLLMTVTQAVACACDYFLALWSRQLASQQLSAKWLWIYAALVLGCLLGSVLRSQLVFQAVLSAAIRLHHAMVQGVLYSPMNFFESQPSGRVLNRFAKDQGVLDDLLPLTMFDFLQSLFMVVGALVIIGLANPWALLIIVPIVPAFLHLRRLFVTSSREVKRLEALARSPVYAIFASTLSGLPIIRTYGVQAPLTVSFHRALEQQQRAYISFQLLKNERLGRIGLGRFFLRTFAEKFSVLNRWLGYRLDMMSALLVAAVAWSSVALQAQLSPSLVGLSIAYVLQLTAMFQWSVRQSAEVENQLTSVERVSEYGRLPNEGQRVNEKYRPPPGWPDKGEIIFENVQMRYRAGLPLVLRGLDAHFRAHEKIGFVGRTGAGKSSIFGVLYRLVELSGGRILIDHVDIQQLGLKDLRSHLSMIPQDPVIFSGTLRYNLDPFSVYTDEQVWESLAAVNLRETIQRQPYGLNTQMAEFGSNMSVGECQLICVARAILKPGKVLFVDEATSSVDRETDKLIQRVLRQRFHDRTTLTIAHRLATILDSTRILVMDAGRAVEFDTPVALMKRDEGVFRRLALESGISLLQVEAIEAFVPTIRDALHQ